MILVFSPLNLIVPRSAKRRPRPKMAEFGERMAGHPHKIQHLVHMYLRKGEDRGMVNRLYRGIARYVEFFCFGG